MKRQQSNSKTYQILSFLFGLAIATGQSNHTSHGPCKPGEELNAAREPLVERASITGGMANCVNGMSNNEYPCKDVTLQSYVSLSDLNGGSSVSANDIWGWTAPSGKEFALVGIKSGTSFVDISNPTNPIVLGRLTTHTYSSSWRDIKVYQNYAYIVSEATGHGLQIFDLTKLLDADTSSYTTFFETAHYSYGGNLGSAHNIFINEDSGFAYIVGSGLCNGGLFILDINNPENPSSPQCFSTRGYTHDVQCVNYDGPDAAYQSKEICFASNENKVDIIDVSNKESPTLISTFTYDDASYTHQGWLTEDKRFFLIDDETDEFYGKVANTRTIICDVSTLSEPKLTGDFEGTTEAIDHNQYVKGDYVYQANYRSGLRILSLTNIENGELEEVAYFDTYPSSNSNSFSGVWSNYPYFASGNVVVSDTQRGLFVVHPEIGTTPPSPSPSRKYTIVPTLEPTISPACEQGFSKFNLEVQPDGKANVDKNKVLLHWKDGKKWKKVLRRKLKNSLKISVDKCYTDDRCYRLKITDKAGDGFCCENGEGFYNLKFGDFKTEGKFENGKKKIIKFGNCGNNRQYEGDDYYDDYYDDDDNFDDDYYDDDDDDFDDDYYDDNDKNHDEDIIAQEEISGSIEDSPLSRINQLIQKFLKPCF